MPRRLISTLLMLSYAFAQMASVPHAHASQPAGHDERVHIHIDWWWSLFGGEADADTHRHPHRDRPDGNRHPHGHGCSHTHEVPNPVAPIPLDSGDHGHDEDCVFVDDATAARQEVRLVDLATQLTAAVTADAALNSADFAPADKVGFSAPLSVIEGDCALYLTLRTLRI